MLTFALMLRPVFRLAAIFGAALWLSSCGSDDKFSVMGSIEDADGKTLYFESVGLRGIDLVDSLKLDGDGAFEFKGPKQLSPEFYRLRIEGQIINIAVDSTETITIKAKMPAMARNYEVEGSAETALIRDIALSQMALQGSIMSVRGDASISSTLKGDSILALINEYKEFLKANYIYTNPRSASAYFALFQTIGRYMVFNPEGDPGDLKAYAAVATSWTTFYPEAERSQHLYNVAFQGMKNERIIRSASENISEEKITEAGIIDIQLADNKGATRSLSELKGKVVLLDFHLFGLEDSPARILKLRELYNKYASQGFEIYQVALDADEHFWKQQTAQLPWISVREPDAQSARSLRLYNVTQLPEFFLIDKTNTLVGRSSQIEDIDKAIKQELSK